MFGKIKKSYTEFYGVKGEFNPPNSNVVVHHVSTIAKNHGGNGNEVFLDHLKPLREYVDIKDIQTLDDVLQRDLDDSRVAKGIVKYLLQGNGNSPTFFPSIVVVLMPKLVFEGGDEYPQAQSNSEDEVVYDDNWKFVKHVSEGVDSNIVTLSVNLNDTIPLVIDGQHRTAAFRYVSGKMDFSGGNEIYHDFYRRHDSSIPESFNGDLPVTILWFDNLNGKPIDVKDFSRKLFVDINQSSQSIAKSRKILLDDLLPSGFLTRAFYDILAEKGGYELDELSLFHSGFDYPKTLGKSSDWCPTSIFIPEIVDYAIRVLLYNKKWNNAKVDLTKGGNLVVNYTETTSFDHHFGEGMHEKFHIEQSNIDDDIWATTNLEERQAFKEKFTGLIGGPLYRWIAFSGIHRLYFDAATSIEHGCAELSEAPYNQSIFRSVWHKVFSSGEGLYYSISDSKGAHLKGSRQDLKLVVDHFENLMVAGTGLDKDTFSRVLQSTRSVAFFVGYVTVPDLYASIRGISFEQSVTELEQKLDGFEWDSLYKVMDSLKNSELFRNIDPKSWPLYRNLILRLIPGITDLVKHEDLIEHRIYTREMIASGKAYAKEKGHNWTESEFDEAWKSGEDHELIDREVYFSIVTQIKEKVSDWFESGEIEINCEGLLIKD